MYLWIKKENISDKVKKINTVCFFFSRPWVVKWIIEQDYALGGVCD